MASTTEGTRLEVPGCPMQFPNPIFLCATVCLEWISDPTEQHYAPGLWHRLDQRAWKSNKRLPVPTAWVITIVRNTENPLLHKIIFKSKMYLIASSLPFKVLRKHKQESAESLWVTDADWLENTPEVVPESWKFYPVFHMHSTATSANPPHDRTMMCTAFLHPTDGVRDFWHTTAAWQSILTQTEVTS